MNNNIYDYSLIKGYLAKNISSYRKAMGLTQIELAEMLNYSDKAVSKWERGEAVPELSVLKQLADYFGVKIDTLLEPPKEKKISKLHDISKKRLTICLCSTGLVWLVAICSFAFIDIIIPSITKTWLSFIYALPISFIVLLVLTSVWGKTITNTVLISLLIWSSISAIYLTIFNVMPSPPKRLWELFLIGIPLQCLTIFWFLYKKVK